MGVQTPDPFAPGAIEINCGMQRLHDLPTPALLLDVDKLESNLTRMAGRAKDLGVTLRPHIKTHKCVEVARRQKEHGARGITVATLHEARVFAEHGFDDLTWAFPVILNRLDEVEELAQSITFRVVVDSPEAVTALEGRQFPFNTWLKVDCGYHRAGVDPNSTDATALAHSLQDSKTLKFDGILTHSGHSYHGRSREEIAAVAREERQVMVDFAARLKDQGIEVPSISVGSTPAMSVVDSLDGITEARPGNYAFYDFSQVVLGSCSIQACALTVLTSVVSSQPATSHCVVDAGALSLSKDSGPSHSPQATMGEIFADYGGGRLRKEARLVSLTQEHGVVDAPLPVGELLRVLPNHSCLAVPNFTEYHVVQGDEVVDRWTIWGGR